MTKVSFDSLECVQNKKSFYVCNLPNDVLKDICYVSRRNEDPLKGFQRTLNETRAKDIARYLEEFRGTIPSAIILSAQPSAKFSFSKNEKKINFERTPSSFLVLDGQHRLFGLLMTHAVYEIPVVIFNHLNSTEEVNLFIDINTTQKGVPTTLLIDIKNLSGKETKKEEKQRNLFDRLNKDSVMAGLFSPAKSKVGKITRVSFNLATNELFENGFFHDKDVDTVFKGVKNYLEAAEIILTESKSVRAKLTNSIFFRAMFAIFHEVVEKSLRDHSDLKVESLINVLKPVSKLNFDSYSGASNATLRKVVSDMKKELSDFENRSREFNKSNLF